MSIKALSIHQSAMNRKDLLDLARFALKNKEIDRAFTLYELSYKLNSHDLEIKYMSLFGLCRITAFMRRNEEFNVFAAQFFDVAKQLGDENSKKVQQIQQHLEKVSSGQIVSSQQQQNHLPIFRVIGFWQSERQLEYPHPKDFQDPNWDESERQLVIEHLKTSRSVQAYRGFSFCRFDCDIGNGSMDLSDGTYLFPEGLVHYLEEHQVRLPNEFIEHVKNYKSITEEDFPQDYKLDYAWWVSKALEN